MNKIGQIQTILIDYSNLTLDEVTNISKLINALFDISKVEVEEKVKITDENAYINFTNGKLIRPATWDDLKKGGRLKVKER